LRTCEVVIRHQGPIDFKPAISLDPYAIEKGNTEPIGKMERCPSTVLQPQGRKEIWLLLIIHFRLDDRAIGVLSPAGAKDFSSSLCVQTGSEAHPASCTMGTKVLSPGVTRGRGVTLTTHPHLVPRS